MAYEKQETKQYNGECPECYFEFDTTVKEILKGEIIPCPDCGLDLEVTGINGNVLTYKPVEEIKEDWGE